MKGGLLLLSKVVWAQMKNQPCCFGHRPQAASPSQFVTSSPWSAWRRLTPRCTWGTTCWRTTSTWPSGSCWRASSTHRNLASWGAWGRCVTACGVLCLNTIRVKFDGPRCFLVSCLCCLCFRPDVRSLPGLPQGQQRAAALHPEAAGVWAGHVPEEPIRSPERHHRDTRERPAGQGNSCWKMKHQQAKC